VDQINKAIGRQKKAKKMKIKTKENFHKITRHPFETYLAQKREKRRKL
jgi:hypothetical protein